MELSHEPPQGRDSDVYWDHAVELFSRNTKDIPFALFYSTEPDSDGGESTGTTRAADSQYQCELRRSVGLLEPSPASLTQLDLRQSHGTIKLFKQAVTANKPIAVDLAQDPETLQLIEVL